MSHIENKFTECGHCNGTPELCWSCKINKALILKLETERDNFRHAIVSAYYRLNNPTMGGDHVALTKEILQEAIRPQAVE